MSGAKKSGAAKIIVLVFCILAMCVTAVLTAVSIYTGGQMKTIDNVYAAVTHGIYSDYRKCFADGSEYLSEKQFDALCDGYKQEWGEDYHLSAEFLSRDNSKKGCEVRVKTTVYNELAHESETVSFEMARQNGKWLIIG